ncbi:MAG: hypothetical protein FWG80_00300 [Alphaproteobacteria bacterium]|nr:hypothetical protein [Alphaproteobacteria bacterium]
MDTLPRQFNFFGSLTAKIDHKYRVRIPEDFMVWIKASGWSLENIFIFIENENIIQVRPYAYIENYLKQNGETKAEKIFPVNVEPNTNRILFSRGMREHFQQAGIDVQEGGRVTFKGAGSYFILQIFSNSK